MNNKDKIIQLKGIIDKNLLPIIGNKCIHADAPYYQNIGDVLIWRGCQSFYQENNVKCLYSGSHETFSYPDVTHDTTICFNGGGNLGDLYPEHMKLLIAITKKYPKNKILVFPQTIYYSDILKQEQDFAELLKHKQIYITARDLRVYSIIKPYFKDNALLSPDMAFYIPINEIGTYSQGEGKLIIDRKDCETLHMFHKLSGVKISDWPVLMKSFRTSTIINKLLKKISDSKIYLLSDLCNICWDWYANNYHQFLMIKEGVRFIKPYAQITTTRLHGCIISIIMDKQSIELMDNSYGKNKDFYNTWLADLETLKLIL